MDITPEMIEALRKLRMHVKFYADISSEFNILDDAGVFRAIDEATGYDTDPERACDCPRLRVNGHHPHCTAPHRVSKCTCPATVLEVLNGHGVGCPGDPAERTNALNFTESMTRR